MDKFLKTIRWFGPGFGVTLKQLKELDLDGIVTACHSIPYGQTWTKKDIGKLNGLINKNGLKWLVVESVPIHNDIKYAGEKRDLYINNYIETIKNLAEAGIKTICYNFMPLLDWTRTDLAFELPNGALSLHFDPIAAAAFDLFILKRETDYSEEVKQKATKYFDGLSFAQKEELQANILAGLPGSKDGIELEDFKALHATASKFTKNELRKNLIYFLNKIIPVAESLGVKMAIHPDDPPFSLFGIPRIVSNSDDLTYIFKKVPSISNGLTFCSGSLSAIQSNNLIEIIETHGERIHFLHLRNIQREKDGTFYESRHMNGSFSMTETVNALINEQIRRKLKGSKDIAIPLRPDHGHVLYSDHRNTNKFYPGYSFIGRAIALAELSGLEEGIRLTKNK